MEMSKKRSQHQFYTPWYAADENENNWITYIHRNLHHLSGEDVPFHDSSWHTDERDALLHDDVLDALYNTDKVDASCIKVVVINSTVSLTGLVRTEEEKRDAEEIVRSLRDTWAVNNELVVRVENVQYRF